MNRSEFVEMVAECMGESRAVADRWVNGVLDCLARALKTDGKVALAGFGSFQVRARRAHVGRNPKTGAPIAIAASRTVSFKATRALKESL